MSKAEETRYVVYRESGTGIGWVPVTDFPDEESARTYASMLDMTTQIRKVTRIEEVLP